MISIALLAVAYASLNAQMGGMNMPPAQPGAPLPSPAATASVTVAGGTIDIHYNTPHMRGRKIMGDLVPYGKVWRTGANPATTIITSVPLTFGTLLVPAGTHTIYTLNGINKRIVGRTQDLWAVVVCKGGAPVAPASTSELRVRLGVSF